MFHEKLDIIFVLCCSPLFHCLVSAVIYGTVVPAPLALSSLISCQGKWNPTLNLLEVKIMGIKQMKYSYQNMKAVP